MEKKSGLFGLLGFIFALLGLFIIPCFSPIFGIIAEVFALVLSIIGCNNKYSVKGLAIAGIAISSVTISVIIIVASYFQTLALL